MLSLQKNTDTLHILAVFTEHSQIPSNFLLSLQNMHRYSLTYCCPYRTSTGLPLLLSLQNMHMQILSKFLQSLQKGHRYSPPLRSLPNKHKYSLNSWNLYRTSTDIFPSLSRFSNCTDRFCRTKGICTYLILFWEQSKACSKIAKPFVIIAFCFFGIWLSWPPSWNKGSLIWTKALQTIFHLCNPKKDLAKTHF